MFHGKSLKSSLPWDFWDRVYKKHRDTCSYISFLRSMLEVFKEMESSVK